MNARMHADVCGQLLTGQLLSGQIKTWTIVQWQHIFDMLEVEEKHRNIHAYSTFLYLTTGQQLTAEQLCSCPTLTCTRQPGTSVMIKSVLSINVLALFYYMLL